MYPETLYPKYQMERPNRSRQTVIIIRMVCIWQRFWSKENTENHLLGLLLTEDQVQEILRIIWLLCTSRRFWSRKNTENHLVGLYLTEDQVHGKECQSFGCSAPRKDSGPGKRVRIIWLVCSSQRFRIRMKIAGFRVQAMYWFKVRV